MDAQKLLEEKEREEKEKRQKQLETVCHITNLNEDPALEGMMV